MSTNESMTQKQLDAIKTRADSVTAIRRSMPGDWQRLAFLLSEDVDTLIAEVERLRSLTTVDEAMVERVARALHALGDAPGLLSWDNESEISRRGYRRVVRAILGTAFENKEEA